MGGCGWLWENVGGCGWLWVVVGGCGGLWEIGGEECESTRGSICLFLVSSSSISKKSSLLVMDNTPATTQPAEMSLQEVEKATGPVGVVDRKLKGFIGVMGCGGIL